MALVDYEAWVLPHVDSVSKSPLASFENYCSPCVAILGRNTILASDSSSGKQRYAELVSYALLSAMLGIVIGVTFLKSRPLFQFL